MYLNKIPNLMQRYFRHYRWKIDTEERILYLTFDDGPTPEVTPWVLRQLEAFEAKATFFLLGNNVARHPELAHQLIDQGHSVGNHTHDHLDGWQVSLKSYLRNFLKAQRTIFEYTGLQTRLFRPPYGRITHTKARYIARTHDIVMMDVIAGDFDLQMSAQQCLQKVTSHAEPGSIILLHDSAKAWPRLQELLPPLLNHFHHKGYRFEALTPSPREPEPEMPGWLIS